MATNQDTSHDNEATEVKPAIPVMTSRGGTVASKVADGDKPVPSTYPSSSHPDGVLPYA